MIFFSIEKSKGFYHFLKLSKNHKIVVDIFIILCYNTIVIKEQNIKYKGENIMTFKEKIENWNKTRGISIGTSLLTEENNYIKIGNEIIILKDFDFEFDDSDAKAKVKALVVNVN